MPPTPPYSKASAHAAEPAMEADLAPFVGEDDAIPESFDATSIDAPSLPPQKNRQENAPVSISDDLTSRFGSPSRRKQDAPDVNLRLIRWFVTRESKPTGEIEVWNKQTREEVIDHVWKTVSKEAKFKENKDFTESFQAVPKAKNSKGKWVEDPGLADSAFGFELPIKEEEEDEEPMSENPYAMPAPQAAMPPIQMPTGSDPLMNFMMMQQQAADRRAEAAEQRHGQLLQAMMAQQKPQSSEWNLDKILAVVTVAKELGVLQPKADPLAQTLAVLEKGMEMKSKSGIPNFAELLAGGLGAGIGFATQVLGKSAADGSAAPADPKKDPLPAEKPAPAVEAAPAAPALPNTSAPAVSLHQQRRDALFGALTEDFKKPEAERTAAAALADACMENWPIATCISLITSPADALLSEWDAAAKAKGVDVPLEYRRATLAALITALYQLMPQTTPTPAIAPVAQNAPVGSPRAALKQRKAAPQPDPAVPADDKGESAAPVTADPNADEPAST